MSLKPTNVPLTVKEFDEALCGVCSGCGCACGYIAYLKGLELIDLYGHPHDPNGIGSFCTKGITLVQELSGNPLRLREAFLREGKDFRKLTREEVLGWAKDNIKGRVALFLDRTTTDLGDFACALSMTEDVFSDTLYLPFLASTLRPQNWRDQKFILAVECETVFSEVMATRWLVDAFERSAHIVAVSSRYATTSAKASKRLLLKPPQIVRFLEELADLCEGVDRELSFGEEVKRVAKALSLIKESLILIGDTLLRSKWRDNVLGALRRIRSKLKVNYSIVGDISPFEVRGVEDFLKELESFDSLILTGNPVRYMKDEHIEVLKTKPVLHLSLFPNLTANSSKVVVPIKSFAEREFFPYRNGFGFVAYSPSVLKPPEGSLTLKELLSEAFRLEGSLEGLLERVGLSVEEVKNSEGGADVSLSPVEEWSGELKPKRTEDGKLFILCDSTLVDELGHWNVWTHDIEREQFAYVNPETADSLGLKDSVEVRGQSLPLRLSSNIAPGVVFVPNSYEELQPFNPGVRIGKLMKNPAFRVEDYD